MRHFADLQGTPTKLLRTTEQVTELLQQAQQARQQGQAPDAEGEA